MSTLPYTLTQQLQQAKNALEDAQINYCGAATSHLQAKRVFEIAEATALLAGVEGRNEKERTAKLRLELSTEYAALHATEDALAEARCGLEGAKLEWDLARYTLRANELMVTPSPPF